MRRFSLARIVAVALVGVIALAAVLLGPGRTRAAAPASVPSTDVIKLRQQRIDTLRQASDLAARQFAQGLNKVEEVSRWQRKLLEAELESAASAEERIGILRKALDAARKQEEVASRNHQAGVASPLAALEAKAHRLRVEIQLAQSAAP